MAARAWKPVDSRSSRSVSSRAEGSSQSGGTMVALFFVASATAAQRGTLAGIWVARVVLAGGRNAQLSSLTPRPRVS